jgi:hypothetical protein
MSQRSKKLVIGIAWYRASDWNRLLEMSEDRDELESSHAEWVEQANRTMKKLARDGTSVRRVVINLDELAAWCAKHNVPVNGESRADFTSELIHRETSKE